MMAALSLGGGGLGMPLGSTPVRRVSHVPAGPLPEGAASASAAAPFPLPHAEQGRSASPARRAREASEAKETSCRVPCVIEPFVYPRNVARWKLLVVDDDPDIRRIALLSLERIGGFQVTLASGGDEALAHAARE